MEGLRPTPGSLPHLCSNGRESRNGSNATEFSWGAGYLGKDGVTDHSISAMQHGLKLIEGLMSIYDVLIAIMKIFKRKCHSFR